MVVSAGIFRIFGAEVAELPLVATVADSQGKVGFHLSNEIFFALFLSSEEYCKLLNFLLKTIHILIVDTIVTFSGLFPVPVCLH